MNKKKTKKFNRFNKFGKKSQFSTMSTTPGTNTNPPSDYYPNPEIQKLASAVNFNYRNGTKASLADGNDVQEVSSGLTRMPGVYANPILHVPGKAVGPTDPLNEAIRCVMNAIRKSINANRDYETPDFAKYLLSIADLQAWVQFLKTVYGVVSKYNVLNAYTPIALLKAMHIDTSDLNNLKIQLAFYINTLVLRIANLKIPTDIPILGSWIHDYAEIYADEDIAKAQYIVNVPMYVWKYVINADTSKGELVPKNYFNDGNNNHTVQDLIDFTEDILTNIINDEDFAIITGDIMKTYPSFHEMTPIDLNYTIDFIRSEEFLEKWHNSAQFTEYQNTVGVTLTEWKIVEDTSPSLDPFVVFNPQFKSTSLSHFTSQRRGAGNRFLDFYTKDVSPDQIINGCLWMFSYKIKDAAAFEYEFETINTSLCGKGEIWYYNNAGELTSAVYWGTLSWYHLANNRNSMSNSDSIALILISKWNYAPMTIINWTSNESDAKDIGYYGVLGDFGNYCIIDKRILQNIATCVLYGQYNISYLLQG